jgi:hypothetical protein
MSTECSVRLMREETWRRENLVDQRTAAKIIGVDVRTLRRWHREGVGPKRQILRRKKPIFYCRVEVEQFATTYISALKQSSATGHLQPNSTR